MSIAQDSVVSIHYTLKDDAGKIVESSAAKEPLTYLHGHGTLLPALEKELAGKKVGDKVAVKLDAGNGQKLNFECEVTEVRAATEEELAHGHVHGAGGHHH